MELSNNNLSPRWLGIFPVFVILLVFIVINTSHTLHSQLLKAGENIWDGYYQLRHDPIAPKCTVKKNINAEVDRIIQSRETQSFDIFDEILSDNTDPAILKQSIHSANQQCLAQIDLFSDIGDRITPGLKIYRFVEIAVARLGELGLLIQKSILAILVIFCGILTTFRRYHISLRAAETIYDHQTAAGSQILASSLLFYSTYSFKTISLNSGIPVDIEKLFIFNLWLVGFAIIWILSVYQYFNVPDSAREQGSYLRSLLAAPLYSSLCLIAGCYFIFSGHPAGISIYLNQMLELSGLFLNIGLYVWIGMLFKRTVLAERVFAVLRPLHPSPEMLAIIIVFLTAVPTAFTGASGIFVIAIGGLIYSEMRRVGARRQLALATTAISGSMGVVIRPCLLVVIIAALNNEVTTDQLFSWGVRVFFLSSIIFAIYTCLTKRDDMPYLQFRGNWPQVAEALKPLIPYVFLIGITLIVYALLLDAYLDEFSAPVILPIILIIILLYERLIQEKANYDDVSLRFIEERIHDSWNELRMGNDSLEKTLREATSETITHVGALLLLMGLTIGIGGMVERSEVMTLFPLEFSSIWIAMLFLVVILVLIGMVLDPYGAVILVSATLATIAYDHGIHPVHFWMVTLVAFELGYLSPPVALNHLLTRQVVGEQEVRLSKVTEGAFWWRYERFLLPIVTLGTTLLITAFMPLLISKF